MWLFVARLFKRKDMSKQIGEHEVQVIGEHEVQVTAARTSNVSPFDNQVKLTCVMCNAKPCQTL